MKKEIIKKEVDLSENIKNLNRWNEENSQKRHNDYVNINSGAWKKKDFHHN